MTHANGPHATQSIACTGLPKTVPHRESSVCFQLNPLASKGAQGHHPFTLKSMQQEGKALCQLAAQEDSVDLNSKGHVCLGPQQESHPKMRACEMTNWG